jgi:hypothetical protein
MDDSMFARMTACEAGHRRLMRLLWLQALAWTVLAAGFVASCASASGRDPGAPAVLRVTELVVVDSAGVERVRIGGELPDAVIRGQRVPRGEKAAGVLLYDGTGQERGGYVTWEPSGNVGLTLDTRERQVTLFVAGPESGAALELRHGDDMIGLRADGDGSRLTAVAEGRVVLQQPPAVLGREACAAYREARGRFPEGEVRAACLGRYPDAACGECLDGEG